MKRLVMKLTAAALTSAVLAISANAQTLSYSAASFHAQIKNATPIIKQAACNGTTGGHGCGPGWVWNGARCVRC